MGLLNFEWINDQRRSSGATPLLEVEQIWVRLGQRLVLDDVSLTVYEGEQVRITGPNGAGKSTLFNAIMGTTPISSGRILFRGENLSSLSVHERAKRGIRYMRQRDNVFHSLTVRENLKLALGDGGYERFREQFPDWASNIAPQTQVGMLSGGQKQKLAWGMTILHEPALLLADEATAGSSEDFIMPPHQSACIIEHN